MIVDFSVFLFLSNIALHILGHVIGCIKFIMVTFSTSIYFFIIVKYFYLSLVICTILKFTLSDIRKLHWHSWTSFSPFAFNVITNMLGHNQYLTFCFYLFCYLFLFSFPLLPSLDYFISCSVSLQKIIYHLMVTLKITTCVFDLLLSKITKISTFSRYRKGKDLKFFNFIYFLFCLLYNCCYILILHIF